MKRSPMKRSGKLQRTPIASGKSTLKRSAMKSKGVSRRSGKPSSSASSKKTGRRLSGAEKLDRAVKKLGYRDYAAYLKSDHWARVQAKYRRAWPDARCLGCRSRVFQLHHIRYSRLGRERLKDLLPFCRDCHHRLHRAHKALKAPLTEYAAVLTLAFRVDPRELSIRLEGYSRL